MSTENYFLMLDEKPELEILEEAGEGIDCFLCLQDDHDLCQTTRHYACRCFRSDHEEEF